MEPNIAFTDMPAGSFPFEVWLRDAETGEELFYAVVAGPGVLAIPALGRRTNATLKFPDGQVLVGGPNPM